MSRHLIPPPPLPWASSSEQPMAKPKCFVFRTATIPANTYRGQIESFKGLDVGSMHFITAKHTDENLVYNVTKIIYENRERVIEKHAAGRAINPNNVIRDTGTEFHPGAIRFYREIGIWP